MNEEIVSYYEYLMGGAITLTNNRQEAKDLVQDTIEKAILKKETFKRKDDRSMRNWLVTILKNTNINNYRKNKLRKNRKLPEKQPLQNKAIYSFIESDFRKQLLKLDYKYKKPIILYMNGYKYKEIAQMTGIPIGTVKARIFKTRQLIKL